MVPLREAPTLESVDVVERPQRALSDPVSDSDGREDSGVCELIDAQRRCTQRSDVVRVRTLLLSVDGRSLVLVRDGDTDLFEHLNLVARRHHET